MELNGWEEPDPQEERRYIDDTWVSIDGTYDDRVICTWVKYGPDTERRSYEVPYSMVGSDVVLGEPQQVELAVRVIPIEGGDEPTADDVESALLAPAAIALDSGISAVKAAV